MGSMKSLVGQADISHNEQSGLVVIVWACVSKQFRAHFRGKRCFPQDITALWVPASVLCISFTASVKKLPMTVLFLRQQKVKEIQQIKHPLTVTSNGSVHCGHLRIVFIARINSYRAQALQNVVNNCKKNGECSLPGMFNKMNLDNYLDVRLPLSGKTVFFGAAALFLSNLTFPSVQGHIGAANGFASDILNISRY